MNLILKCRLLKSAKKTKKIEKKQVVCKTLHFSGINLPQTNDNFYICGHKYETQ